MFQQQQRQIAIKPARIKQSHSSSVLYARKPKDDYGDGGADDYEEFDSIDNYDYEDNNEKEPFDDEGDDDIPVSLRKYLVEDKYKTTAKKSKSALAREKKRKEQIDEVLRNLNITEVLDHFLGYFDQSDPSEALPSRPNQLLRPFLIAAAPFDFVNRFEAKDFIHFFKKFPFHSYPVDDQLVVFQELLSYRSNFTSSFIADFLPAVPQMMKTILFRYIFYRILDPNNIEYYCKSLFDQNFEWPVVMKYIENPVYLDPHEELNVEEFLGQYDTLRRGYFNAGHSYQEFDQEWEKALNNMIVINQTFYIRKAPLARRWKQIQKPKYDPTEIERYNKQEAYLLRTKAFLRHAREMQLVQKNDKDD
jgi:hypothetical protein